MSENEKKEKPQASWLGFLLPPLVVVAAGFLWWAFTNQATSPGGGGRAADLEMDQVYYVVVSQVELFPTNQHNDPWDSGSAASPDIRYQIIWQGNTIHESDTEDNTLIAEWSGVTEAAIDKLLGEKMIRAGQVRADKDGELTIQVEDVDLAKNDPAGTVQLKIIDLHEGVNDIQFEKTADRAIKRLRIKLVSKKHEIEEIIRKLR